jgi:hypothetical protein
MYESLTIPQFCKSWEQDFCCYLENAAIFLVSPTVAGFVMQSAHLPLLCFEFLSSDAVMALLLFFIYLEFKENYVGMDLEN